MNEDVEAGMKRGRYIEQANTVISNAYCFCLLLLSGNRDR